MVDAARDAYLPVGFLIDGRWEESGNGGEGEHVNPATGDVQRRFPYAADDRVDAAVRAARTALPAWRQDPVRRRRCLMRLSSLLEEQVDEFHTVAALERGAPLGVKRDPATILGSAFEYSAGAVDRLLGSTIPVRPPDVFDFTMVEPVGVVAVLPSWNGPMWSVAVAVAPALAAGCTVVLKSPERAPFSCAKFGQLCVESGLPNGVVNVLTGGPATGEALVSHPGIDKIHFTGGYSIAKQIQAACAPNTTPAVLELGGKSASIIFKETDVRGSVTSAVDWLRSNAGQSCTGGSRVLVQESVYEEAIDAAVSALNEVRVGDPFDESTTMGPLISDAACQRVVAVVSNAVEKGDGKLALGGYRLGGDLANGFFVPPTLMVDVDNRSPIAQEEIFGPVITMTAFRDEAEAISLANDSRYGLAGYVYTRDMGQAIRVASALDVGSVGVNGGSAPAGIMSPFGGFKSSGYGWEGGDWGLAEFLRTKNVMVKL